MLRHFRRAVIVPFALKLMSTGWKTEIRGDRDFDVGGGPVEDAFLQAQIDVAAAAVVAAPAAPAAPAALAPAAHTAPAEDDDAAAADYASAAPDYTAPDYDASAAAADILLLELGIPKRHASTSAHFPPPPAVWQCAFSILVTNSRMTPQPRDRRCPELHPPCCCFCSR